MRNISESCRKFGLRLGVYVSPRDDHFGAATGGICKTLEEQRKYNTLHRQQVKEVLSRYGGLIEIWFDGSVATPVDDLISTYQPNAATGTATALDSDPNGSVWLPNEVDVSIRRPDWCWRFDADLTNCPSRIRSFTPRFPQ